ncbi:ATP-dependent helicase [Thermodesulforhabdus norvegica]|uniref:DNA 3'-5' helicase n=1 Tax=Thermodesulforhabdus norvegica TaxID=39841 RepID=A0A1I4TC39_9BACT|nr:UvrD-helicase domain-containing protein [Thermodesulforhabdus norvegica]SFM74183.1 DNA helicase-2 / ATP-dependent DNA helicase PcrA [Thermodesulforhabdus norvegica]
MEMVGLSPEQEKAVRCTSSPVIVAAGAGSGKTRTLTAKIAYLVKECGYSPQRILAITFTNKAADEMKSRLRAMTGLDEEAFPWVRTFHSACFRILKQECHRVGLERPISVRSDSQQTTILKGVLLELNVDKKYLQPAKWLISMAKNSGDPYAFMESKKMSVPGIRGIYDRYNEILRSQNAVDFDDILLLVKEIMQKWPDVRRHYQELFDYILVDEFQDSNRLQNDIMELLVRNGNLTVVGDDYQSIYTFRGAEPRFFLTFPESFPGCSIVKLEQNYRSTSTIVSASNALIAHNRMKMEKRCYSLKEGPPILAKELFDERDEAEWIAHKCREYFSGHGIPWHDMAVLYRTRFCSKAFEEAFRKLRIPYRIVGARGFYESKEIQDINAYLVSAVNPRDDLAFERIINVPRRGVGAGTLKKINSFRSPGTSLQDACWLALQSGTITGKAAAELTQLKEHLSVIAGLSPKEAISFVMDKVGYESYLQEYARDREDFINRLENVELLTYVASKSSGIEEFLEECALIREEQDEDQDGKEGVKLMTFHAAKGLEFRIVFVAGVEEGLIPHWRSLFDEDSLQENIKGVEEERRLMYVAMTRAIERLHITWALSRQGRFCKPSRFLWEIPEEFIILERIEQKGRGCYDHHHARR